MHLRAPDRPGPTHQRHDRVVLTRNGRPAAVLISPDELESLEETLEIPSDPGAVQAFREAEAPSTLARD